MPDIREGDTIIGADGRAYTVTESDGYSCRAEDQNNRRRTKHFSERDVFCVDANDGLWQELEK